MARKQKAAKQKSIKAKRPVKSSSAKRRVKKAAAKTLGKTRFKRGRAAPRKRNATADQIIQTCTDLWPNNNGYCNQFVIAVAAKFGVTLTGLADDIVDEIQGDGWTVLADGSAAGDAASQGKLVIGGEKSATHVPPATEGHVVVVVNGTLAMGKYPTAFWGSDDATVRANGDGSKTVNYAWNKDSRDLVTYASHDASSGLRRRKR